jgi:hypothetical protein
MVRFEKKAPILERSGGPLSHRQSMLARRNNLMETL